jgi:hypothetical protein
MPAVFSVQLGLATLVIDGRVLGFSAFVSLPSAAIERPTRGAATGLLAIATMPELTSPHELTQVVSCPQTQLGRIAAHVTDPLKAQQFLSVRADRANCTNGRVVFCD